MLCRALAAAVLLLIASGCGSANREFVTPGPIGEAGKVGVLVMAHGGSAAWNETVAAVVDPLRVDLPTALAFGMADPEALRIGLDSLRSSGVTHVAVVRMFISGKSFLKQTRFLLGLSGESPQHDTQGESESIAAPEPTAIDHGLVVATHESGLMGSREAEAILTDRARSHSRDPGRESVLLIAHGMGDNGLNDAVLEAMEAVAVSIRKAGFASVRAETLREDWPEERAAAELRIRDYVARQANAGRDVIVVPMRLSGLGPIADVLDGFAYAPTEALLPHSSISDWIRSTVRNVICLAGWEGQEGAHCQRQ